MGRFLRNEWVIRICRMVIGFVFIVAAMAKIGDVGAFSQQIHNFKMVPIWSENLFAMTLPWVELFAGLSLMLGIRPRSGGVIITALMAVFVVAVLVALKTGLDIDCGCCGTAHATRVGLAKLAVTLALRIIAFIGTLAPATAPGA